MLWLVNGIFKMKLVPCEIWSNFLFSWLSDFLYHIHQLIYLPVYHCTNDFSSSSFWYFFIFSNSLLYEMFFFDFILAWSMWNCFPVILFALSYLWCFERSLRGCFHGGICMLCNKGVRRLEKKWGHKSSKS